MYRGVRRAGEGQGGRWVTQGDSHARSRLSVGLPYISNRMVLRWHQLNALCGCGEWTRIDHRPSSLRGMACPCLPTSVFAQWSNLVTDVERCDLHRNYRSLSNGTNRYQMKRSFNDPGWGRRYTAGFRGDRRARARGPGAVVGPARPGNGIGARDDHCAPGPGYPASPGKFRVSSYYQ